MDQRTGQFSEKVLSFSEKAGRETVQGAIGEAPDAAAKEGILNPAGELALGLFSRDVGVLLPAQHCATAAVRPLKSQVAFTRSQTDLPPG